MAPKYCRPLLLFLVTQIELNRKTLLLKTRQALVTECGKIKLEVSPMMVSFLNARRWYESCWRGKVSLMEL